MTEAQFSQIKLTEKEWLLSRILLMFFFFICRLFDKFHFIDIGIAFFKISQIYFITHLNIKLMEAKSA